MRENLKRNSGITLIAMIITIIVMLVLAGVSMNAIIGDNGILSNAMNATTATSVATLQEYLQEKYIEYYDFMSSYDNKVDGMLSVSNTKSYFQQAANNLYYFWSTDTYKEYYLIEKSALPDEIQNQLVGGDTSLTGISNYVDFSDIYGVTTDLEVWYCDANGNWIGATDTAEDTDLNRVIASSGSAWATALGYDELTLANIKAQTGTLTISTDGLDLSLLSYFSGITKIVFQDVTYSNLSGIEKMPKLTQVEINGSTSISDYSALGRLSSKLTNLYFIDSNDTEIATCFSTASTGIGNYDFTNLQYLAITSEDSRYYFNTTYYTTTMNSNITTISPLSNLSNTTKEAITYLCISCNNLTSIENLNEFTNLYFLKVSYNYLTSLSGLGGLQKLAYIYARNNLLGSDLESSDTINTSTDSLSCLATVEITASDPEDYEFFTTVPKLYYLNLCNNTNLVWINYVKNTSTLKYIYLDGCTSLSTACLTKMKSLFTSYYSDYSYSSKYSLIFLTDSTTSLDLTDETVTQDVFEELAQYTSLTGLNLSGITITDDAGDTISGTTLNTLVNETLSSLTNLEALSLYGLSGVSEISFVENMPNLNNLELIGTSVTTNLGDKTANGLELLNDCENMYSLSISNSSIDLYYIQDTISRLGMTETKTNIPGKSTGNGLRCTNTTSLKTLEKCTSITNFVSVHQNWGSFTPIDLDMSECLNLTYWNETYWVGSKTIILPSSLKKLAVAPNSSTIYDLTFCTALESISYDGGGSNLTKVFQTIENCSSLTTITMKGDNCVAALANTVSYWKLCKNISTIYLGQVSWSSAKISISSLSFLSELTELENLTTFTINLLNLTDGDYSYLQYLTHLTSLTITNSNIEDISSLANLINLQSISLSNSQIINGLQALSGHTSLTTLNLTNCPVLDVSSYDSTNYNVCDLFISLNTANGGGLAELYLSGTSISSSELTRLTAYTWSAKSGF